VTQFIDIKVTVASVKLEWWL